MNKRSIWTEFPARYNCFFSILRYVRKCNICFSASSVEILLYSTLSYRPDVLWWLAYNICTLCSTHPFYLGLRHPDGSQSKALPEIAWTFHPTECMRTRLSSIFGHRVLSSLSPPIDMRVWNFNSFITIIYIIKTLVLWIRLIGHN